MDFSKIPEPLIEPNKMGFLGKAFLASLATTLVVNGTMLPYYRLSVESVHKDCLEVGEALEKEGLSKGWDRTKRTFNQWRQDGLFSSVDENSTLEARAEACENLGPLVRANIWYAEQVILPIEENWVITIGRRDPSTLDAGKKIALETAHQTKEGVSNAYERTRDWAIQSWDGLWGDQDEATQDIDIVPPQERAPPPIPTPSAQEETERNAPTYDENGDPIKEQSPDWRERTKDTFDGIDWTPWN